MSSTQIVFQVGDFEFHAESKEAEPTVLDLVIGHRVGLARPRDVRKHIRRGILEGAMREGEHFRRELRTRRPGSSARRSAGNASTGSVEFIEESPARQIGAGQIVDKFLAPEETLPDSLDNPREPQLGAGEIVEEFDWPREEEFWLTETGALKLITRLRTPAADAMVDEIIRVYREAIRKLRMPERTPPVPILAEVAHGARMGDTDILRREMEFYCHAAKVASGCTLQCVHGFLRREFRLGGVYHLSVILWHQAKGMLEAIGIRRLLQPLRARRKLAPPNPKQGKLWS